MDTKYTKILAALGFIIGFIISLAVGIFFGAIITTALVGLGMYYGGKLDEHVLNSKELTMTFTRDGCAFLYKKSKRNALSIVPHKILSYNYQPDSYVYTGTTVGGVTTGQARKVDAHYELAGNRNSGRYCMEYHFLNESTRYQLKKIVIENLEILAEAKQNPRIRKMLKGNEIILIKEFDDVATKEMKNKFIISGLAHTPRDIALFDCGYYELALPSFEECTYLNSWLSN